LHPSVEPADGTFTLVWDLGPMAPSTTDTITFPAADRAAYQANYEPTTPTVGNDSLTNTETVAGNLWVRCDWTDPTRTGSDSPISHDGTFPAPASATATASQAAVGPTITVSVSQNVPAGDGLQEPGLQAGARRSGDGGVQAERLQVGDEHVAQPAKGCVAAEGRLGEDREVVQGGEIALLALEAGVDERDVGDLLSGPGQRHARDVHGAGWGPAPETAEAGLGGVGERWVVALGVHRAAAAGGDPGGAIAEEVSEVTSQALVKGVGVAVRRRQRAGRLLESDPVDGDHDEHGWLLLRVVPLPGPSGRPRYPRLPSGVGWAGW
jgi:hypothetical protein